MEACVFEIPIYRCSFEEFTEQMERDVEKFRKEWEKLTGGPAEEAPDASWQAGAALTPIRKRKRLTHPGKLSSTTKTAMVALGNTIR